MVHSNVGGTKFSRRTPREGSDTRPDRGDLLAGFVFSIKTSMDRILFAVLTHENKSQGLSTPFLLTQNY
jgi:hypothetical protein